VSARASPFLDLRVVAFLFKVLSSSPSVSKIILFLSARVRFVVDSRLYCRKCDLRCRKTYCFSALEFVFRVEGRNIVGVLEFVLLSKVVIVVEFALEFISGVVDRIVFERSSSSSVLKAVLFSERSSSFCCRQSSLLLSVLSILFPVSKFEIFFSAGVSSTALKAVLV
jgi:hypothetical protein